MSTLPNGLRVVTDTIKSVESVAMGVWIGSGARAETATNNGTAHMVEHMLFKGTAKRNAKEIVSEIESVGGQMNAYTSREVTSYHIHLMKDHAGLAMDVLSDMVQGSTLPQEEIERERQVILQEIGMTQDTPDDLIFDLYQQTAYDGQSVGAPILGTSDHITHMPRETLQKFIDAHYTPDNMVLSVAGNMDHDACVALAGDLFTGKASDTNISHKAAQYTGGERRAEKELEQTHVILGFEGVSRLDETYYAAQALSAVLGGGMSSRLFQEVREKRGLAYSVFSFHSGYQDTGQFGVYAATSPEDVADLVPVICGEALKIMDDIKDDELARAKHQLKSSIAMGRESMMTRADQHAKFLLQRNKVFSQDEVLKRIDGLTRDTLHAAAQSIFTRKPTLCAHGLLGHMPHYDDVSRTLLGRN